MTSIIYALTLGCVIFLCVSLNLLLKSINGLSSGMPGADILVTDLSTNYNTESPTANYLNATVIDPTLRQYSGQIKNFGYVTRTASQIVGWNVYMDSAR